MCQINRVEYCYKDSSTKTEKFQNQYHGYRIGSSIGLEASIFVKIFKFYLVTQ